jgi:replicative DNA helicase
MIENLERYFILSLLMDPECIQEVREMISPQSFIDVDCKRAFLKILELYDAGEEIDRFSLAMSGAISQESLDAIFGLDSSGVIFGGERLAQFILKRNYEEDFKKAVEEKETEKAKELAESILNLGKPPEWKHIKDLSPSSDKGVVIKTGFALDRYVKFYSKDLCILAGKTQMGKTTLGMNILGRMSREHPSGLISFEMGEDRVRDRIREAMTDDEISKVQYFASFPTAFNLATVRRVAQDESKKKGVKVQMIDYLQLMSETKKFSSRHLEVSYIVRQLKEIAKQLDILIILIASLSRSIDARGKNAKPLMGDLKESGDIEYAADTILFLHRDEDDQSNRADLIVAKNRHGKKAVVDLVFVEKTKTYQDWAKEYDKSGERFPGEDDF